MSLENRIAVITGATGGLGRAVARRLAEEGARLVLVGSDSVRLEAFGKELGLPADRWLASAADLTSPTGAQGVAEATLARFGRIDMVLHLVGGWTGGKTAVKLPVDEMTSIVYLCSDAAGVVNGAYIPLYGAT